MKKAIIILAMAVCLAACDQVEPYGMEMDTAYVEVVVDNWDEAYEAATLDAQEIIDAKNQEIASLYTQINRSDANTAEANMLYDGLLSTMRKEENYSACLQDIVRECQTYDLPLTSTVEICEMELE